MKNQTQKKIDRRIFKKTPEELEQYMYFRRRGFCLQNKKAKAHISVMRNIETLSLGD